jgi:hypothetical protein
LTDPHGLGLCNHCGYCQSLEEARQLLPAPRPPRRRVSLFGLVDLLRLPFQVPLWGWGVLAQMLVAVPPSYLATLLYSPHSRPRAIWALTQLGLGLAVFVAGTLGMLWFLHNRLEQVGFLDLFWPGNLWRLALRRLPESRGPVSLTGAGFVAALCAALWVGGLSYWIPDQLADPDYEPDLRARATPTILKPGPKDANSDKKPRKPQPPADREMPSEVRTPTTTPANDERPTAPCSVVGYVLGSDGKLSGLVLGTERAGRVQYAGVVNKGFDEKAAADLLERLSRLPRSRPLTDGIPGQAVWVKGEVQCEVHQSGIDARGRLVDPAFKAVVPEERRKP